MATYIVLVDFTEQGIRNIRESPARAETLAKLSQRLGAKVQNIFWTSGSHDGVLIVDAPDAATVAKLTLSIGRQGNVRTETLRAFGRSEIESIIATMR